jgi:hypothetical protein
MPLRYRVDRARNLVETGGTGVITDADVLALKHALLADPAVTPSMVELTDLRAVESREVTVAGIRQMVGVDEGATRSNPRLAIVASSQAVYGMARMYQQLTERSPREVGVFDDLTKALAWLGLTADV